MNYIDTLRKQIKECYFEGFNHPRLDIDKKFITNEEQIDKALKTLDEFEQRIKHGIGYLKRNKEYSNSLENILGVYCFEINEHKANAIESILYIEPDNEQTK